jgi:hypothetical protein
MRRTRCDAFHAGYKEVPESKKSSLLNHSPYAHAGSSHQLLLFGQDKMQIKLLALLALLQVGLAHPL